MRLDTEAWGKYRQHLERQGRSPKTIRLYRLSLECFWGKFLPAAKLPKSHASLTKAVAEQYADWLLRLLRTRHSLPDTCSA